MNRNHALREAILDFSRQNRIGPLSPWFSQQLDRHIESGYYREPEDLQKLSTHLIRELETYRQEGGVSTCVLGMSGGVDSALTASLFKKAGWKVIGVTMPIHQLQTETDRGIEAINALGLDEHVHVDLSQTYDNMLTQIEDRELASSEDTKAIRIRRGNVRARLRMITLYNLASKFGGLVASTDNLSELSANFWTSHGDVGDLSPIQALTKSWEVPFLSQLNGVPEATVHATPTDGLGIDAGDEAQLGCSYLEWDLLIAAMAEVVGENDTIEGIEAKLGISNEDLAKFRSVSSRMRTGWFKRYVPMKISHCFEDRYGMIAKLDRGAMVPNGLVHLT